MPDGATTFRVATFKSCGGILNMPWLLGRGV